MAFAKALGGALALNRTAFGLTYLLRPQQARGSWIGRTAAKPPAQVMIRSQGVRDVALGAGALAAMRRGEAPELRRWLIGHGVSDLADLIATWQARDHLPRRQSRMAMGIAGASTLAAALALTGLRNTSPSTTISSDPEGAADERRSDVPTDEASFVAPTLSG